MNKYLYLMVIALFMTFASCSSNRSKSGQDAPANAQSEEVAHHDKHALLGVRGSCEMCKERIEKEANSIPGVTSASYNLEKEQLHFHFDESKTSVDAVSKALAAVGHDTERDKAPDDVYDALPGCCKYREL